MIITITDVDMDKIGGDWYRIIVGRDTWIDSRMKTRIGEWATLRGVILLQQVLPWPSDRGGIFVYSERRT